ncbi:retrotransposon protein, putative, ty1-copia subclass, partial [Tanacetum coccineum]
ALVKRDTPDKLQQRSVKCIFIGYPKETIGYYFYFPLKNKIVVVRYDEFFEKNLITQEVSGRAIYLEEIQDEDTSPTEITSEIPMKVEGFEPPQEEEIPIRRFERSRQVPNRLCLNVEAEEHSLGDLNEPTSYKSAMLDSKSNKWIDAMNAEIQSMMDNMVWVLVDLPPGCKTVGSFVDPNHPRKASGSNVTFLILYVDDIIIMGNHILSLQSVKDYLGKCFAMKDLGEAAFILGIKIYRDRSKRLIGLCQNAYMDKILKRYKMDNSKRGHIPMQERLDLNKSQGAQTPKEVNRMKNVPYASAVGSIMYAVRCTRPDVAFAQNMTSRFQQNPGEPHWTAVKNILKYLRNTKDMFLVYGGNPSTELRVECYCDAGFETDRDDTKSQTGYVFVLNGGAVDWKSSKQSTTAMSATESEYIAASEAAMEAVWIRKFISGLGIVPTINEPLNMYCDNSAAVHYANEPGVQKGARHYQRRYHYVRECVELGEIRILKVHTDNNLADPFTKALSNRKLTQHARGMGLRPASSFM